MPRPISDDEVNALYRLPLSEFTGARNALAKQAGAGGPAIRQLEKPSAAAWAVNQLYWRERQAYDALIRATEDLRAGYRAQLAGQPADVRPLEAAHADAVKRAVQSVRAILAAGGDTPSPAVVDAVRETLDVLPGAEPPGRLARALKRTGFEALQGFEVAAGLKPLRTPAAPPAARPRTDDAGDARRKMNLERLRFAEAAEREAGAALERTVRALERAARVRERIEDELRQAVSTEQALRKEETAKRLAVEKAAAERQRLSEQT